MNHVDRLILFPYCVISQMVNLPRAVVCDCVATLAAVGETKQYNTGEQCNTGTRYITGVVDGRTEATARQAIHQNVNDSSRLPDPRTSPIGADGLSRLISLSSHVPTRKIICLIK